MSTLRQKHSHLYAPKTLEVRLSDSTPFEVPGRRNLILKVYTDTASPVLKLSTDLQKVDEGDRVLIENIPGSSESSISVVYGPSNTVAGTVGAKVDETFRFVNGEWLLEPAGDFATLEGDDKLIPYDQLPPAVKIYPYTVPTTTTLFQIPNISEPNALIDISLQRGDAQGITIRLPLGFPQNARLTLLIKNTGTGSNRGQIFLQYPLDDAGTSWGNYKTYEGSHAPFYVDHFVGKIGAGLPWSASFPGTISQIVLPCSAQSPGTSGPVGFWGYPSDLGTITAPNQNRREFHVPSLIRIVGAQLISNIGGTLGTVQGPSVDPLNPFLSINEYDPGTLQTNLKSLNITNPNFTVIHNNVLNPPAANLSSTGSLGIAFPSSQYDGVFDMLPNRKYTIRIKWPTFSGLAPTSVRNTVILYYIDPYKSIAGLYGSEPQIGKFLSTPTIE